MSGDGCHVIDHKWATYAGTSLDQFQYGYDLNSNRILRDNLVAPGAKDEFYSYSNWDQLKNSKRGDLNANRDGISGTAVKEEDCQDLDPLGNWKHYVTKANAVTDLDQTRSHTVPESNPPRPAANEITQITNSVGTAWVTPVHDLAGNMTTMPSAKDPTVGLTAKYDAWNRLVELRKQSDNSLVGSYAFDGQGRRISKQTLTPNETRHFYYTTDWQIIEERTLTSGANADRQYVWGLNYVDELVLRDRDTNSNSSTLDAGDEHLYALQDANWNVTAIVNPSGTVVERYVYDPYGKRTVLDGSWNVLPATACFWNIGHQGLYLDEASGIYENRARMYQPLLGRFVQRDPTGYVDGMGLYVYGRASPLMRTDAAGLCTCGPQIDAQLIAMRAELYRKFQTLAQTSPNRALEAIRYATGLNSFGWEVPNLMGGGVSTPLCQSGRDPCAKTVTVAGKCWPQGAVAYWLAGSVNSLGRLGFTRNPGYWFDGELKRALDGFRTNMALYAMGRDLYPWGNDTGEREAAVKMAWFDAGDRGDPNSVSLDWRADPLFFRLCGRCPETHQGPITWHVGNEHSMDYISNNFP